MARNPLDKQTFLSGVRQKFFAICLLLWIGLLGVNAYFPHIDAQPYLVSLSTMASLFILGASSTAYVNAQAAKSKQEKLIDRGEYRDI